MIQMHRKAELNGLTMKLNRSILGWVAIFGSDYVVYFSKNDTGKWSARRPHGMEPIAVANTLEAVLLMANRHWEEVRPPA